MAWTKRGAAIFRDYATDGVPASGAHKPPKIDIRVLFTQIEDAVDVLLTAGGFDTTVFTTIAGRVTTLEGNYTTDHGTLTGLVTTVATYNNRFIGLETRLSFRPMPMIVDGLKLLVPQFYLTRTGSDVVAPPAFGANASMFFEVDVNTGPNEARHYVDLPNIGTVPINTVSGDTTAPLVSTNSKIIFATSTMGRVAPVGRGIKIVGTEYGGVAASECTFARDMDRAPRLRANTQIGDITAAALTALGFTRGAYDLATLTPYVGARFAAPRVGQRAFIRVYVQPDSDYGFGTPSIRLADEGWNEASPLAMTLERVLSPRAASYIWTGPLLSNTAGFVAGIEGATGHDIRVTGLQFATGFDVWWIKRDDFPIAPTIPLQADRDIHGSTRLRMLREYVGTTGFTKHVSRLKVYTPAVTTYENRLIFTNWGVAGGGTGEFEGANDITVQASVEPNYTPAFIIPVTFGGKKSVTINPGGTVISDPIPPAFSADSYFWVKTELTVASGTWPQGYYAFQAGEASYSFHTTSTPATQVYLTGALTLPSGGSPTPAAPTGGYYGPSGMLSRPTKRVPCVVLLADSIGDGYLETSVTTVEGYLARGLQSVSGHAVTYARLTRASETMYATTAPYGWRKRQLFYPATHGIVALGTNDIVGGTFTFTDLKNLFAEIVRDMRAHGIQKIYASTIAPRTTSTNNWANAAGQTAITGFGVGGLRDQFNTWLKSGADLLIDGVIDVNLLWEDPSAPGKWNTNGTAYYPTTDGIHPTSYFQILAATLVTALAIKFAA